MKLVIAIVPMLIIITFFLVSAQGEVQSLKTDRSSYVQTNKIIFSGTVDVNDTGKEVNLQITGPNGNYLNTFTTMANVNGSFQIVVDTSNSKIQSEFTQPGTYSAIAFIQIRSSTPVSFDYSPIPPPPPRPLSMQHNSILLQNKTQNSTTTFQNQSKLNINGDKIHLSNQQVSGSKNNTLSNLKNNVDVNIHNPSQDSTQSKQSASPSTSGNVDCSTLSSDQVYKCQQSQMYSELAQKHMQDEQQRINQEQYQQEQQKILEDEQTHMRNTLGIIVVIVVIIVVIIIAAKKKSRGNSIDRMKKRANMTDLHDDADLNKEDDGWKGI